MRGSLYSIHQFANFRRVAQNGRNDAADNDADHALADVSDDCACCAEAVAEDQGFIEEVAQHHKDLRKNTGYDLNSSPIVKQ